LETFAARATSPIVTHFVASVIAASVEDLMNQLQFIRV